MVFAFAWQIQLRIFRDGGRGHAELFQRQRGLIERQKSVVAGQHLSSFMIIVRTYSYAITGDLYLNTIICVGLRNGIAFLRCIIDFVCISCACIVMPPLILQLRIAGQIRLAAYGYLCFYRLSRGDNTAYRVDDINISDMRDHRNNNAIRIGLSIIGYRRRDSRGSARFAQGVYDQRTIGLSKRGRVRFCRIAPYDRRFLDPHVGVGNRQRGLRSVRTAGDCPEGLVAGDGDARVLFCRSTAGFPRQRNLAILAYRKANACKLVFDRIAF